MRSINFNGWIVRGQFKGMLYLRVSFNSLDDGVAHVINIVKLDRNSKC